MVGFTFQRRLSDPSSNLQNYTRNTGWKPKGGGCSSGADGKRTRSQSDGLDHCGLAEIEAGDLRDGMYQLVLLIHTANI